MPGLRGYEGKSIKAVRREKLKETMAANKESATASAEAAKPTPEKNAANEAKDKAGKAAATSVESAPAATTSRATPAAKPKSNPAEPFDVDENGEPTGEVEPAPEPTFDSVMSDTMQGVRDAGASDDYSEMLPPGEAAERKSTADTAASTKELAELKVRYPRSYGMWEQMGGEATQFPDIAIKLQEFKKFLGAFRTYGGGNKDQARSSLPMSVRTGESEQE